MTGRGPAAGELLKHNSLLDVRAAIGNEVLVMARQLRGHPRGKVSEARPHAASLGHLEDCWDEPPPGPARRALDCERLQGAWLSTAGARQAALLISGSHFTLHFADGDIYMGRFELDTRSRPRAMVSLIDEGPARFKGQTALCFYEFDGDHLRWCTAGPGRTERPAFFPAAGDPNYLCLVFRREERFAGRRP
jgi:uncharacterized protein (TIGR03067 family)